MSAARRSRSSTADSNDHARLERARVAVAAALIVLGVAVLGLLVATRGDPLAVLAAAALGVAVLGLVAEWLTRRRLSERLGAREAAFTRILSGLSRSVSPEAIVQAIVDELHRAADADHVVVARLRPADGVVEMTLVASNPDVPPSRSLLPVSVLDPANADLDAGDGPTGDGPTGDGPSGDEPAEDVVAAEIARRARRAYGLAVTLASPLVADGRIVGALVLSRRGGGEWSVVDRRLLDWSAEELSAALARAFAFEAAEARANIDALTGLPNRRYLEELLSVVGPRRRSGDSLGALMIDIDHFKRLNDRYGHATGDRVLHAVGQAIAATIRNEDTPARYGGEEFAVVLRQAQPEQAVEIAERIRRAIGDIPPQDMGIREPVSVSVGVAVSSATEVDVTRLLATADRALYRAKREGRDRVVLA